MFDTRKVFAEPGAATRVKFRENVVKHDNWVASDRAASDNINLRQA
jgi:hypothetical protein